MSDITCPKCGETSGNDWSQCEGSCPMRMSPHFVDDGYLVVYDEPNLFDWRKPDPQLQALLRDSTLVSRVS